MNVTYFQNLLQKIPENKLTQMREKIQEILDIWKKQKETRKNNPKSNLTDWKAIVKSHRHDYFNDDKTWMSFVIRYKNTFLKKERVVQKNTKQGNGAN